uniref:AlNc14C110G6348 protein n=1 Tax=Albugo laibachii Nc14 TaxID=890382 RepID=F0WIE9_9STRA|nr:AlNc14C110G6348 [Albugo laibachii Nc14]|eukprot:CCA21030.1 AlNc14C110G6348 [Albugo laibachii Nc14]
MISSLVCPGSNAIRHGLIGGLRAWVQRALFVAGPWRVMNPPLLERKALLGRAADRVYSLREVEMSELITSEDFRDNSTEQKSSTVSGMALTPLRDTRWETNC